MLSVDRVRPGWATAGHLLPEWGSRPGDRRAWAAARGTTRWAMTGDLAGAFPGFGRVGGQRGRVRIRLTDRYLLADEGRLSGFALPLASLETVARQDGEGMGAALVVRYRWGGGRRSFLLRPRGSALFRSRGGLEGIVDAFGAVGTIVGDAEPQPSFLVDWGHARAYAGENVIWSGLATASAAPWGAGAPADVWLSTRSLLWSVASGEGLARLPLDAILDATPIEIGGREPAPGVALGVDGPAGERFELVLRFDRHRGGGRDGRERGAFVVGLRSRGIPIAAEPVPVRPWLGETWTAGRRRATPPTASAAAVEHPDPKDAQAVAIPESPPAPEGAIAPSSTAARPAPSLPADGRGAANGSALDPAAVARLEVVAAFEAGALAVLAKAGRGDGPGTGRLLIGASLAVALAELDAASASGSVPEPETEHRRRRLVALNEAAVRLRALAELRGAGYLRPDEFDRKRRAILAPLNEVLFGA